MNTYKTIINYQLNIEAENEEELNKIISKLTLPNQVKQKVVKTSKINTNCLSCGVEFIQVNTLHKICTDICRYSFHNEKYKKENQK
jgi:DNA-binding Xre family transcriptional regulator